MHVQQSNNIYCDDGMEMEAKRYKATLTLSQ